MYFITTKRMLEVCFSAHPNIQYRTYYIIHIQSRRMYRILPYRALPIHFPVCFLFSSRAYVDRFIKGQN